MATSAPPRIFIATCCFSPSKTWPTVWALSFGQGKAPQKFDRYLVDADQNRCYQGLPTSQQKSETLDAQGFRVSSRTRVYT